mmetsp:Transcript_275/g.638  ORF Transcript_275/g.638 Transcript_275/m.638 type:complete len:280 (+) Transcript_275:254-1093(+)
MAGFRRLPTPAAPEPHRAHVLRALERTALHGGHVLVLQALSQGGEAEAARLGGAPGLLLSPFRCCFRTCDATELVAATAMQTKRALRVEVKAPAADAAATKTRRAIAAAVAARLPASFPFVRNWSVRARRAGPECLLDGTLLFAYLGHSLVGHFADGVVAHGVLGVIHGVALREALERLLVPTAEVDLETLQLAAAPLGGAGSRLGGVSDGFFPRLTARALCLDLGIEQLEDELVLCLEAFDTRVHPVAVSQQFLLLVALRDGCPKHGILNALALHDRR